MDRQREDKLINQMKKDMGGPGNMGRVGYMEVASTRPSGSPAPAVQGYASANDQTTDNLLQALRISETTGNIGYSTIQSLGVQREVIQHSLGTVDGTHEQLLESRRVLRDIRMSVYKEWLIKGSVIAALVMLIILVIYSKFSKRR